MCTQKKIKIAFSMKMVLKPIATAIKLIAAVFSPLIFTYKAYLGASGQNLKKWLIMASRAKNFFFRSIFLIVIGTSLHPDSFVS